MGDDEKQKERIAAKNGLESYCFNMKSTMEDENLKAKISEEKKKPIITKCDEALKWLESNQLGEVDEFQDKQKELEAVCNPIISKLYQQGGAPGGTMPNGMPNGMHNGMAGGMPKGSASAGSNSGPRSRKSTRSMLLFNISLLRNFISIIEHKHVIYLPKYFDRNIYIYVRK